MTPEEKHLEELMDAIAGEEKHPHARSNGPACWMHVDPSTTRQDSDEGIVTYGPCSGYDDFVLQAHWLMVDLNHKASLFIGQTMDDDPNTANWVAMEQTENMMGDTILVRHPIAGQFIVIKFKTTPKNAPMMARIHVLLKGWDPDGSSRDQVG